MLNDKLEPITLGGIIKHTNGHGFKITCNDTQTANRIKDMIRWILENEFKYKLVYNQGVYDIYDEKGDRRR